MSVRAKFRCISEMRSIGGGVTYKFLPVVDDGTPENERYHRFTPAGELTLVVDNPTVVFLVGGFYYADMELARETAPA